MKLQAMLGNCGRLWCFFTDECPHGFECRAFFPGTKAVTPCFLRPVCCFMIRKLPTSEEATRCRMCPGLLRKPQVWIEKHFFWVVGGISTRGLPMSA